MFNWYFTHCYQRLTSIQKHFSIGLVCESWMEKCGRIVIIEARNIGKIKWVRKSTYIIISSSASSCDGIALPFWSFRLVKKLKPRRLCMNEFIGFNCFLYIDNSELHSFEYLSSTLSSRSLLNNVVCEQFSVFDWKKDYHLWSMALCSMTLL